MVYLNTHLKQSNYVNKKIYDNYDTYTTLTSIPDTEKVHDRLYYITSENKHYRYDTNTSIFVEFSGASNVDLTPVYNAIATKQDNLIMENANITLNENILALNNDISVGTITATNGSVTSAPTTNNHIVNKKYIDDKLLLKQNTISAGSNLTLSGNTLALNNSIDISGYVVSNTMTTNSIQSNTGLFEYILMKSITNPSNPNTITISNNKLEWNNGGHSIQRYSAFFASEVFTQYETTPLSSQNTLTTKSYVDNQVASGSSNGHTFLEYASSTLYINTTNKIIDLKKEDLFLERTVIGEYLQMQTSSGMPSIKIDANSSLISGCTEAPTEPDHLTNKAYVDSSITSILPTNNKVELIVQVITHNRTVKMDNQSTTNISSFTSYYTKIAPGLYNINLNSSVTFSNSMNMSHYLGFQILRKSDNKVLTTPDTHLIHVYIKSTLFKNHESRNDSWVLINNFLMIDGIVSANGLVSGFSTATQNSSNVAIFGQFLVVANFV